MSPARIIVRAARVGLLDHHNVLDRYMSCALVVNVAQILAQRVACSVTGYDHKKLHSGLAGGWSGSAIRAADADNLTRAGAAARTY